MNKLSAIISFIKEKRKILASLFLTLGIFSALIDVLILTQRPQTYSSKAAIAEVVFKNQSDEVLPINQDGLSIAPSSEVVVELNPPGIPKSYKIGENPAGLDQAPQTAYQNPPVKFSYTFKNLPNNTGTIFVEFIYPDGEIKRVTTSVLTNQTELLQNIVKFTSPKTIYGISYDKRYWIISNFGPRVIFNLNKEYGSARLDISEGETDKDLNALTDEVIKLSTLKPIKVESVSFKEKPASLLTYKEQILGEDVYFEKLIFKEGKRFITFEKRAPKLGYNQSFLDNLLQNFSFTILETSGQVKGISNSLSNLTTVELVDLVRPSIANIVYVYCLDIVNLNPKQSLLSKPKYQFCSSSKGSGFIVNEKGTVATNGHVVKVFPEEGLVTNLLNQGSRDFTTDLIKGVYLAKGQASASNQVEQFYQEMNFNPQYLDRFLTEIFDLISKKIISVSTSNEKYYVNLGNEPIEVDYQKIQMGDWAKAITPSSTTYTAKLIGFDYPNKYSYEAIVNKNYERGADVALLQIEGSTKLFPALELGSIENLREGSDVIVAGYPSLVEGDKDPRAAISYKTSTKPTITKGIVSAIKQDLSGKTVLQTDASIDHGNSGGPAFNSSAQVVGLATFMTESKTGNFNFLRDVKELKDLMSKNNIENKQGKLTSYWGEGLDNFRNQYYSQAIKNFREVETLSSSHPTVKELIETSEKAITKGESLEGLTGLIKGKNSNTLLIVFGGIAIISFMSAGFLIVLPLFIKDAN